MNRRFLEIAKSMIKHSEDGKNEFRGEVMFMDDRINLESDIEFLRSIGLHANIFMRYPDNPIPYSSKYNPLSPKLYLYVRWGDDSIEKLKKYVLKETEQ